MIPPTLAKALAVCLFALPASRADAALYLQIRRGSGGAVSLRVEGSGVVTATNDNFLTFGTTGDTSFRTMRRSAIPGSCRQRRCLRCRWEG